MIVSFIAAMDRNRVIGKDGNLPWDLPNELQHFRNITKGKPVIMGRKTHEAIGRVLPDRLNIVLTRQQGYASEGCMVVHSINEALEAAGDSEEVFVIGGGGVYKEALSRADKLYLTYVDGEFEGDVFFPEIDMNNWQEVHRLDHDSDERHAYGFSMRTYIRNKPA